MIDRMDCCRLCSQQLRLRKDLSKLGGLVY